VQNAYPPSCNRYDVTVAIALVNLLQLVETTGSVHLLIYIYINKQAGLEFAPS
jgi:hypothetical protein